MASHTRRSVANFGARRMENPMRSRWVGKSGTCPSAGEGWRALAVCTGKFVPELAAGSLVRATDNGCDVRSEAEDDAISAAPA